MNNLKKYWKLNLGLMIFTIIASELLVRVFIVPDSHYAERINPTTMTRQTVFVPKPSSLIHGLGPRFRYFTNEDGLLFTDQVFTHDKPKGVTRLLLLGGSNAHNGNSYSYTRDMGMKIELIPCLIFNSNLAGIIQNYKTNCSRYEDVEYVLVQLNLYPKETTDRVELGIFYGENLTEDPSAFNFLLYKQKWLEYSSQQKKRATGVPYFQKGHQMFPEFISTFEPSFFYRNSSLYKFLHKKISYKLRQKRAPYKEKILSMIPLKSENTLLNLLGEVEQLIPEVKIILSIQPSIGFKDYYQKNKTSPFMKTYASFRSKALARGYRLIENQNLLTKQDFRRDGRHYSRQYHDEIADKFQQYIKTDLENLSKK